MVLVPSGIELYNCFVLLFCAGFAFIISLVREVVKDVEDIAGDQPLRMSYLAIVWGVRVSKVFAATWMVVLIAVMSCCRLISFNLNGGFDSLLFV